MLREKHTNMYEPLVEVVIETKNEIGESPVWDERRGSLWWVDILRGELHEYRLRNEVHSIRTVIGQSLGFIAPFDEASFAAGTRSGIGQLKVDSGFELTCPVEAERRTYRMNDGKCDPRGFLWAGTMSDKSAVEGNLYRVGPGWHASHVRGGMRLPNGMAWTKDGTVMCLADSVAGTIEFWEVDGTSGLPSSLSASVTVPPEVGKPDGMTVDSEDCFWVAIWGGGRVQRYTARGTFLGEVRLPAPLTASCAFGGDGLNELYVTTARRKLSTVALSQWPLSGAVFRVRAGVTGEPPDVYRA